jgi:hypothetical protein
MLTVVPADEVSWADLEAIAAMRLPGLRDTPVE